jgi:biopolymer transport protein ExbD
MARSRIRTKEDAAVDMTPMLDVVFIMLIFFIVTASFVKESGIDVSRPNANTAEQQQRGNILVAIRPNGEIWIDRRSVDVRALRANVERLRAENPEGTVVIMADKESQTGLLVEVMDQIRLAGVSNVAIAAEQSGGS